MTGMSAAARDGAVGGMAFSAGLVPAVVRTVISPIPVGVAAMRPAGPSMPAMASAIGMSLMPADRDGRGRSMHSVPVDPAVGDVPGEEAVSGLADRSRRRRLAGLMRGVVRGELVLLEYGDYPLVTQVYPQGLNTLAVRVRSMFHQLACLPGSLRSLFHEIRLGPAALLGWDPAPGVRRVPQTNQALPDLQFQPEFLGLGFGLPLLRGRRNVMTLMRSFR